MSSIVPIEVVIEGRIVKGHPMTRRQVNKQVNGVDVPQVGPDDQPITEVYIALAIPKNGATDWRQAPWGQQIAAKAAIDWPNGEHGAPTFSWKIVDGDSQVPNGKGNKPCDSEGFPGHFVIHMTNRMGCICNHAANLDPMAAIAQEGEINCGDYGRVLLAVKGNGPVCQSPGVYQNLMRFCLDRAGTPIITVMGSSASDAFGAAGAVNATTQQAATPMQPATDLLQPGQAAAPAGPAGPAIVVEVKYLDSNGAAWTEAQLLNANYTAEMIAGLQRAPA